MRARATGSTTTRLCEELVRLHREEDLSFQNVVSFNLDECYPTPPGSTTNSAWPDTGPLRLLRVGIARFFGLAKR